MNSDEVLDRLDHIARVSGFAKRSLLHEDLKPYFVAAYNPFVMYYNTRSPRGEGINVFNDETWMLLDALSQRVITGDQAKAVIKEHVSQLTVKSAILFNRILNKDLRIGMRAKTINTVFPGLIPTHDVMLAKRFDPKKVKFPCYGGVKIDGIRGTFKHEKGYFYTRTGHKIQGLEHLEAQLIGTGADIDGELYVPDWTFQKSSGYIRSDSPSPAAAFVMFEVPTMSSTFAERLMYLEYLAQSRTKILRLKHYIIKDLDHAYKFYSWCRAKGYEGAVLRPMDYEYVGTRSWSWMKMKNIMDFDLKVISLYEGKGKYKGQMGGAIVDYFNGPQRVGGGFSDQQRRTWWNYPANIIGKTIQVVVTEFTDGGNFRHARMGSQGIREDK